MQLIRRWKAGIAGVVALAAGLTLTGAVQAQQQGPLTLPMQITENRIQGASGQVIMTPQSNNQVRVEIRITGLQPNAEHAAHIHAAQGARCDTNAPIIYPLENVRVDGSGAGTSTTTLTLNDNQSIQANNSYVNVHQGSTTPGPGVICANITRDFSVQSAQATATPRPGTGGPTAPTPQPGGVQQNPSLPDTGTSFATSGNSGASLLVLLGTFVALVGTAVLAKRLRS